MSAPPLGAVDDLDLPVTTRAQRRRAQRRRAAASVFGLALFAIALPLVRVLADAPEFLIAHRLDVPGTLIFFGALIVAIPALLAALASIPGRIGRTLRGAIVVGLSLLAVAGLAQPISGWAGVFWLVVLVGGIALAVGEHRNPTVRSTCALLSVLAVLLAAWAVGPSRVGRYVRSGNEAAVRTVPIDAETPVVVVVLDELSLVPVLDSELQIDAERFPNLAGLAATSHWFRLASSISPQTSASVPALLSGVEADPDLVPIGSQYPGNLFRRLSKSHDLASYEPITSLCGDLCDLAQADEAEEAAEGPDVQDLVDDTGIVLRHALGTDQLRAELPSISQGWAGFGSGDDAAAGDEEGPKEGGYGTFFAQTKELHRLLRTEPASDRPALRVAHVIAPHLPWVAMPDGSVHSGGQPAGLSEQNGALTWGSDEGQRRAGYQRYLLQVGALDREIGAMRTTLEEEGLWDEALVVVTADHGLQFQPGTLRNVRAGGVEVTSVPLFVKEPGQTKGVVDDRAALTLDVVPTILGALGASDPAGLDGVDLLHDEVPERRAKAFLAVPGERVTPDQRLSSLRNAVERRASWVDPDGGWPAVYQAGVRGELVGTPVRELGATAAGGSWTRAEGESGRRVTYAIEGASGVETVLLVCDGVVAGAVPVAGPAEPLTGSGYASHQECADPSTTQLAYLDGAQRVRLLEQES